MYDNAFGRIAGVSLVIIAILMTRGGSGQAQEGTPPAAGLAADPCAVGAQESIPAMMTPGPMGPGMMTGDPELMALDMLRHHAAVDVAISQVAVARAEQPELRALAEEALRARQAETDQLTRWREQWYPGQPELPMGPIMGPMMGMMMGDMLLGTPWPGMPAMPAVAEMLPLMGMMGMGPTSVAAALCAASPVDAAVADAMIVSAQMTQVTPQMMQQWGTRRELRQFAQDAAATRRQELEQLLQVRQSLPAAGSSAATATG